MKDLIIKWTNEVPDGTYFRTGDAEPIFDGRTVTCRDGRGTLRSSWGAPGVTSTVVVERPDFVAVHVGFYHKHGGGQFWRYYRPGKRVMWRSLSEAERLEVLDGWIERAPGWAKCPGKLKKDYLKPGEIRKVEELPDGRIAAYKWLKVLEDGRLASPRAFGQHVWKDGRLVADVVPTEKNTHGIYAVKSRRDPALTAYGGNGRVLTRIALSGTVIEHETGYRAEVADVLEVLE